MDYELLYIVPGRYTETELTQIIKQVENVIQKNDGVVNRTENLDKKKLAYPIKQICQGYYILHDFTLESAALVKLNVALKLMNEIIRHQIVKKITLATPTLKAASRIKIKPETISPVKSADQETVSAAEITTKPDNKIGLEELDKKIDEILKKDIY